MALQPSARVSGTLADVTALVHDLGGGAGPVYATVRDAGSIAIDDPRVIPINLDMTAPARVQAVADQLSDVSLVINNAGVLTPGPPLDTSLATAGSSRPTISARSR